ncbi:MAG: hypothetical protein ACOYO0_00395 [Sandarakinorhabdus sp.]
MLAACTSEVTPEQAAAQRAEALVRGTGRPQALLLGPVMGLDGRSQAGVCGLIETPAGPVRVVVDLAAATVRIGVPATQGGHRGDLGESRFCSEAARARWQQVKTVDPVGLMARVNG